LLVITVAIPEDEVYAALPIEAEPTYMSFFALLALSDAFAALHALADANTRMHSMAIM
jgi:hypothetical protein